jgi:hypothetical protein
MTVGQTIPTTAKVAPTTTSACAVRGRRQQQIKASATALVEEALGLLVADGRPPLALVAMGQPIARIGGHPPLSTAIRPRASG